MYDGTSQLLVANPIHRYLLNSTTLKAYKYGPDGSLTFYVQKDSPGKQNSPTGCPRLMGHSMLYSASTCLGKPF